MSSLTQTWSLQRLAAVFVVFRSGINEGPCHDDPLILHAECPVLGTGDGEAWEIVHLSTKLSSECLPSWQKTSRQGLSAYVTWTPNNVIII